MSTNPVTVADDAKNDSYNDAKAEEARIQAEARRKRVLEKANKRMGLVSGEIAVDEETKKASTSNAARIRAARQRRYGKKTEPTGGTTTTEEEESTPAPAPAAPATETKSDNDTTPAPAPAAVQPPPPLKLRLKIRLSIRQLLLQKKSNSK